MSSLLIFSKLIEGISKMENMTKWRIKQGDTELVGEEDIKSASFYFTVDKQ